MKLKTELGGTVGARVRCLVYNETDRRALESGRKVYPVKDYGWQKNLVFDTGLNALAGGFGYANLLNTCGAGSGTNPNSYSPGTAIFTQVATTITATSTFFTSLMVGGIFKYGTGTGGAEQYITAIGGGGLSCTVSGAGMTVATATAGTVWMVQQTGLQTSLGSTNTYLINGSTGNTFTGTSVTLTQNFQFATPGSTWSVNEICYGGASPYCGRIALSSTVTVSTAQFLVCTVQILITQTPNTPTGVANVGTGINTAGTGIFQNWLIFGLNSANGNGGIYPGPDGVGGSFMDARSFGGTICFYTGSAITLNSNIGTTTIAPLTTNIGYVMTSNNKPTNSGQPVGVGVGAPDTFAFTTAGETVSSIVFGGRDGLNQIYPVYILNLTTPLTLPTGSFSGTWFWQLTFTRQLSN